MMNYDDRTGRNPPLDFNRQPLTTVNKQNPDGTTSVIRQNTGQVLYTGSAAGAAATQAKGIYQHK